VNARRLFSYKHQELFVNNNSVQMTGRSRLAVVVSLGLAVAAAACSGGARPATSPSGVTPSSLEASGGQSTREFSVTIAPASVVAGDATLHVTVTRNAASGQSQKLGSVEIYVPGAFTIQSVSNISNANWKGGVSGQTVRVGADAGNHKLDGTAGWSSVTFDINVTSTACGTYAFADAKASNATYSDPFDPNWTYTGSALSVTVTDCSVNQECDAAPAVANAYLDSIHFRGGRGDINSAVGQHMTQGARFDGIEPCDVEAYRAAVIAFVDGLLKR
jgi:hypothetical protein